MTIPVSRRAIQKIILSRSNAIRRTQWGKIQPLYNKLVPDWSYQSIVIHHSGNFGRKDPQSVEHLHMTENLYDDVGYHFLLHPSGKVYEGREIVFKGSHVSLANSGRIGILMMGDYDHQWWDLDDELTTGHIQNLNNLISLLMNFFPIQYLGGHKEFLPGKGYSCPGDQIMNIIDKLRSQHGLAKP